MEKAGFPVAVYGCQLSPKGELAERAVVVVDEAGQIGGRQMLDIDAAGQASEMRG